MAFSELFIVVDGEEHDDARGGGYEGVAEDNTPMGEIIQQAKVIQMNCAEKGQL